MIKSARQAAALLRAEHILGEEGLYLKMGEFCLCVRSNSHAFLQQLAHYFAPVLVDACEVNATLEAYESEVVDLGLDWRDWAREPGKTGKKDAYVDLEDGRLLLKVRTGMLFLQSEAAIIALGPCRKLDNQVINFINSQYMNWLQQHGWLICHAAGLAISGYGLGIAGLSGGGKSTLMLELMEYADVDYLTNDRLFIRREDDQVMARGIPKMPRINPGTIVHNPALHGLIDAQRRQELLALPKHELWHLEEKYDVMIPEIYGAKRMAQEMPLNAFLILNWSHDSEAGELCLSEVELDQRQDLLPAIMKSPGPFYQFSDGAFYEDAMQLEPQAYLEALQGVSILEASGRVDIPQLRQAVYQWAKSQRGKPHSRKPGA